ILKCHNEASTNRDVHDFVGFFNARYRVLSSMISNRPGITRNVSISRLRNKTDRESVSIIGLVSEMNFTKNNNLRLTLEDPTGSIQVVVTKNNKDLYKEALTLTLDEVIGVTGMSGKNVVFASEIIWPEVPVLPLKKSPLKEYAIVLSDLHVGSNLFLEKEFTRFIKWIRGEIGSQKQHEIAKRTKYIFIVGDLVDGVGVYPEQYNELAVRDIYEQYKLCAQFISRIPKEKAVIICPGNHDALRLAEPQPPLSPELARPLYEIPNVIMVSNPAIVNIGKAGSFPGFNVLMYHGYGFDYYVANVDPIRNGGGYERPELIMSYLLKRRHLAPTHGSTLYVPYKTIDPLLIDEVPDIFVSGHIHKSAIKNYRNITLVSGSCWQAKTSFQEKVGHEPEPCRVPIIDLHTRRMKILKFGG
ncbi:DNA-directed DNA polymerase II small subunit, partial [Candidatus Woesearchaeota archaeon]|nr:DNA-directed DNA polymerase II small subunit [Candidatus Woesearchaeota archaeon]